MVKCKIKTFQKKCNKNNKSTVERNLKRNSLKPKEKRQSVQLPKFDNQHKDRRWFQNDPTLSEKQKVSKRLAKASLRNCSGQDRSIFNKESAVPDLFNIKLSNRAKYDSGLSDSSDSEDENKEESIYKPSRLEEKIRESKIKKFEKREVDNNVIEKSKPADDCHLDYLLNIDIKYEPKRAKKRSYEDHLAKFQLLSNSNKKICTNAVQSSMKNELKPKTTDNNKLIKFLKKTGFIGSENGNDEEVGIHKYLNYAEDNGVDLVEDKLEEVDLDECEEDGSNNANDDSEIDESDDNECEENSEEESDVEDIDSEENDEIISEIIDETSSISEKNHPDKRS